MKVAKWGNSLAIRLPANVVEALQLQVNDEIEIRAVEKGALTVGRKPSLDEMLERVRKMRGLMPKDFKFNRDEANER